MKPLTRRSVMAGSAAAVTVIPALALPVAAREGGELAALVRRYFVEVEAFNAGAYLDDDACDAEAAATYEATLDSMIGVPARTRDDAIAALDWLIREGADLEHEFALDDGGEDGPYTRVVTSLVDAIRGYLEGRSV